MTVLTPASARSSSRRGSETDSGSGAEDAGLRILRQVEPVARDVGVGLVEQRRVIGVAAGDVLAEVRCEAQDAVLEGRSHPDQLDAARGEVAEVDGVTAVRATDRDRDVLCTQGRGFGVPEAQNAEPPAEVATAIPARGSVVRPDGEVDRPPRLSKLVGDLDARRSGPDDQHGALGQLCGVAVAAGVHLQRYRAIGNDRREDGTLERSRRRHDEACVDDAVGRLHVEAGPPDVPRHRRHLDPAPDRRADLLRVGDEVVRDLVLRGEGIGIEVDELQTGEAVVPGRSVRDEGIPALRAPALGDAVPLQDEVRDTLAPRCSLIARPAWPPPTTRTSTSWLDIPTSTPNGSTTSAVQRDRRALRPRIFRAR